MFKKFSSLFTNNKSQVTIQEKFSLAIQISDENCISNNEVANLVIIFKEHNKQGDLKNAKEPIKLFFDYLDQIEKQLTSHCQVLKILIIIHLLLQSTEFGNQVGYQLLKRQKGVFQMQKEDEQAQFVHQNILKPYFAYLFRLASNWEQFSLQDEMDQDVFYFYSNISNLGMSLLPQFKQVKETTKIFSLIKKLALILYLEIEKFYRKLIKKVITQMKQLDKLGHRVIELNELYCEIEIMEKQLLSFYQFIVTFKESKTILPPQSINIPKQQISNLKSLTLIELSRIKKKQSLQINTAVLEQQDPFQCKHPPSIEKQITVNTAKASSGSFSLNLANLARPEKEIHTHRHEKRSIDFEKYRAPMPIQFQETNQIQELDEEPELDNRFMMNDEELDQYTTNQQKISTNKFFKEQSVVNNQQLEMKEDHCDQEHLEEQQIIQSKKSQLELVQ